MNCALRGGIAKGSAAAVFEARAICLHTCGVAKGWWSFATIDAPASPPSTGGTHARTSRSKFRWFITRLADGPANIYCHAETGEAITVGVAALSILQLARTYSVPTVVIDAISTFCTGLAVRELGHGAPGIVVALGLAGIIIIAWARDKCARR